MHLPLLVMLRCQPGGHRLICIKMEGKKINRPSCLGSPRLKWVPGKLGKSGQQDIKLTTIPHRVLFGLLKKTGANTICPIYIKACKGSLSLLVFTWDVLRANIYEHLPSGVHRGWSEGWYLWTLVFTTSGVHKGWSEGWHLWTLAFAMDDLRLTFMNTCLCY